MSAQASQTSIPTAQAGSAVSSNYNMFVVGARYEATPTVVTDGQIRGFQIANDGKLVVAAVQSGTWTTGRTWVLSSGTDSVAAVQSGTWTVTQSGTWTVQAVQSGAWTTGRTWTLSNGTDSVAATQSGTWSVNQGTANTAANAWTVKVTDGTNVTAVKAASTAPLATDPAAVVALSPNGNQATAANQTNVQSAPGTPQTTAISVQGNASGVPINIADSLGNSLSAFPAGFLRTTDEPRQVFYDPFDSTLDTTNRWNAAVSSGGGVAASVAAGVITLGTGTTASGYSYIQTQASFTPTIPGWLGTSFALNLTDGAAPTANTYRFWGCGTIPGTPTAAAPLTNAYGFELATTGKMYAVVYINGTRNVIQDLSSSGNSKQPLDANLHRYIIYYRTDKIYFYIDGLLSTQLVATANFVSPQVQTLPEAFLAVANTVAPASSGVITCAGCVTWDTAKNNSTISDGTFGWRKATIKSASAAPVATDTALVVAMSPNSQGPITPTKATLTDGSGSTSGTPSTSTQIMASNASRKYLFIQNCSSSQTIWINFTTAAVANQPSIPLLPYAAFVQETGLISTEAINVLSTGASVPYVAKQA